MQVWDSVVINDELDLLELRLRLLDDVVDRFIVVEADKTFRGAPKPFHVRENIERFRAWSEKLSVVGVELDRCPVVVADNSHSGSVSEHESHARENQQKWAQRAALSEAAADDLIIVGDLDEIPRPSAVRWLRDNAVDPVRITMRQAVYRANWEWPQTWFDGSMASRGRDLDVHPMIRLLTGRPDGDFVGYREDELRDGGWHFTSLGAAVEVRNKLDHSATQADTTHAGTTARALQAAQDMRVHHQGRGRLRTNGRGQMDEVQSELLRIAPDLFDFTPAPARWRSDAHSAACFLASHGWLPERLGPSWERGRLAALPALGLGCLEQARIRRRRRHVDPWSWKRGRTLDWSV